MNKKILILTKPNCEDALRIVNILEEKGNTVICYIDKLESSTEYNGYLYHHKNTGCAYKLEEFDLVLSYFYKYIIPQKVLAKIKRIVNCHISYLPWGRGSQPNVWAIVNGEPAGVTIHELTDELDAGNIIVQKAVNIFPDDTGHTLYNRLLNTMYNLTVLYLDDLIYNTYTSFPQDYESYMPNKTNDFHDLRDLTKAIESVSDMYDFLSILNIIRACSFNGEHPGAYLTLPDGSRIYIDNIKLRYHKSSKINPTKDDLVLA